MYFFFFKLILDILPKINKRFVIKKNTIFYKNFSFKIETILMFSELEYYYKFFKNISLVATSDLSTNVLIGLPSFPQHHIS